MGSKYVYVKTGTNIHVHRVFIPGKNYSVIYILLIAYLKLKS